MMSREPRPPAESSEGEEQPASRVQKIRLDGHDVGNWGFSSISATTPEKGDWTEANNNPKRSIS